MKTRVKRGNMKKREKVLIMQDEDISVYNEDFFYYVPDNMRLGGVITVVNNHNNKSRHKEWKWYRYEDGTMFNDKEYIIKMLSDFVREFEVTP